MVRLLLSAVITITAFGQAPAPASGVVSAGTGSAYVKARELPARIMEFKAEPASVRPGQSVTLTWGAENPTTVTIEPGLGKVTPRGLRQVTPAATTTYTLNVTGPNNANLTRTVTVTVEGTAAVSAATSTAKKEVPRRDGKPDFSGVFNNTAPGVPGAPAQPPTLKAGAEKFKVVRGPTDTGFYSDCMPVVPPMAFSPPYQFQIAQSANHVIIMHEYPGTFRVIPIGGAHPADPDPTWLGDSIARWEGDTLVVDSVGFNDKTEIQGYRHTDKMHLVERFSRPTFEVVQYEAVIEDPNVFAAPWKITRSFGVRTDLAKIDEFVCEHNQDYGKLFEKK